MWSFNANVANQNQLDLVCWMVVSWKVTHFFHSVKQSEPLRDVPNNPFNSRPQSRLFLLAGGVLARETNGSGDTGFDWLNFNKGDLD